MNRMEQSFTQNGNTFHFCIWFCCEKSLNLATLSVNLGYQPDQSPNVSSDPPTVELPANSRGVPTPEALSTVLQHAQRLLSGPTISALSVSTLFKFCWFFSFPCPIFHLDVCLHGSFFREWLTSVACMHTFVLCGVLEKRCPHRFLSLMQNRRLSGICKGSDFQAFHFPLFRDLHVYENLNEEIYV